MEMNESLIDEILINKIEKLFIKKENVERNQATIGAVITAASEMAKYSNIVGSIETTDQLLELYHKEDDPVVKSLLGMVPAYVENTIGYSADFIKPEVAKANYESEKETYNEIYNEINARIKTQEIERKLA